jgi:hypothetical protein
VTPNHVLVPAYLDHSCPFGPPIPTPSTVPVPNPSSATIDVTVIDAGYWWDTSWGQNTLDPLCTLNASLAKIIDASGHLITPTSWEGKTQLEPGGVLNELAGHANFVAGMVAQQAAATIGTNPAKPPSVSAPIKFHPNIHLWNHPGAFYPPPTPTTNVDGFPTEFTVCVSILDSQGYPGWTTLSSVLQIGFAYATYSGQTGSYMGLPSVAWDVVFGLLTKAHQTKKDSWIVTAPAGNQDSNYPCYPAALATVTPSSLLAPSNAFANIVGVASDTPAVDPISSDNINGKRYSNYGSWVLCSANGSGVTSTFISNFNGPVQDNATTKRSFSGYATWNGTSFVSPKVAAAFAQVIAANPSPPALLTPSYVIKNVLPNKGYSSAFGVELDL